MDINELVEKIVNSDNACEKCACATDEECMASDCRDKILEYLKKQMD